MLLTNIFSFSHYVFYPSKSFQVLILISFALNINAFNLDQFKIFLFG